MPVFAPQLDREIREVGKQRAKRWTTTGLVTAGVAAGLIAGFQAWSSQQVQNRYSLFHANPRRRLAALGYLRAYPSVDSARLLREYLRWEPLPFLRRRARGVLRQTELLLRS